MTQQHDIQNLIAALSGEPDERQEARIRLVALGDTVVEPLMALVAREQGRGAWTAVEILGELADERAFPTLVAALDSDNPMLAGMAVQALLHFEEQDILPHLVKALPHVHIMTQQNIILALQDLADKRAVHLLIEQLDQVESPTIRTAIIKTLGELGDPSAIEAIRPYEADSNHHVREWTAVALTQLEAASLEN